MSILNLLTKEIWHSKLGSISSLVSILVAIGSVVGAFTLLNSHELRTSRILDEKLEQTREEMVELKQDMRKATLKLGFNVVILPKEQKRSEWFRKGYGTHTMPEKWATRVAHSRKVPSIRHIQPVLQKKIRWRKENRTVMLLGTKGEVERKHFPDKSDLVKSVPEGKVVVGHALHTELGIERGDKIALRGHSFTVEAHRPPRGSEDDITLWMNLADAQKILNKPGRINAIIALQCMCTGIHFADEVRSQVKGMLPGTKVIVRQAKAMARAKARISAKRKGRQVMEREKKARRNLRQERETLAGVLVPVVLLGSAVWIGLTAMANVKERRGEIAVLRAMGMRSRHVLGLLLSKAATLGLIGGAIGYSIGFMGGRRLEAWLSEAATGVLRVDILFQPGVLVLALGLAPCLAAAATLVPALLAAYQDPAEILSEE